ncbi:MAG TPA: iron ABC transporter permease, partial [Alphaproteobacteria bacterium]|nr:iron ABC transporter permease [Alphaproteobacteria bacterium]
ELTATYVIRPFNFDTLAIRSYQLIIDERIIEASLPALTLVILGIIPVILLSKQFEKSNRS